MQKTASVVGCLQIDEPSMCEDYINRRLGLERRGNWCGHRPDLPRFFKTPEAHKARPKVLTWAIDAWSRFYTLPSAYFKELRIHRDSDRQQRTESREALASIAQVLLHYTELASLRVGVPHASEGFRSLTIEFIAKKAGIGLKRAQRAIKLLVRAGYLKMIERFDIKEERFIGLAAVKCLTPSFFKACGIKLQLLSSHRILARKRLNKKRSTYISNAQEQQASARKILDFIAPVGNRKVHVDAMMQMLASETKSNDRKRENENNRRRSRRRTLE